MSIDHTLAPPGTPRRKSLAILLALPLLIGALTACSTADSKPSSGSQLSFDDYQLAYAQCMRDEGIDYPDPESGQAISPKFDQDNADAMNAASNTCTNKLGTPPAPPGGVQSEAESKAEMLEMAQCFRDHGLDVPDPKDGEGFSLPTDAPDEVFEACGITSGGSGAVTVEG
ncbi:hypothetical protein SAMN06295974_1920 [Plantibacter flavus]|uniref:Uncharacterized protein n=1 Tax=Plantibacter flavus TaxID=150123 RepID=A0A3N2BXQ1_9MICO|nr:hypothetical protein [Plantibacter flavus]ROR80026.1 hypothetical protein EDD42_0057 [Plantibacter flavus]SMG28711.1 hypothetical protein SAMN06295974_1920 [Plantibacter flavus]